MSAAAPPLVALAGARLGYRDRVILEDVDLEVRRGDFLAIVGPNGAGKTTALRTILGIIPPLAGRCEARGRLGYSPQRGALDPIFPFTAAEVVAMGLLAEQRARGRAHADEAVRRALAACGMEARRDAAFRDLSGGQKQRVLVARALVSAPDVLVLDEPTNDLDLRGEHEVMELVRALHDQGRTVVMVSHMLHVVARYARRIAFVRGGRVVAGDLERMLTAEQLAPLYDGLPVVVGRLAGHAVVAPGREGAAEAAAEIDDASPAPAGGAPGPAAPPAASGAAAEAVPAAGALGLADLAWRLAAACLAGMTVAGLMAARGERRAARGGGGPARAAPAARGRGAGRGGDGGPGHAGALRARGRARRRPRGAGRGARAGRPARGRPARARGARRGARRAPRGARGGAAAQRAPRRGRAAPGRRCARGAAPSATSATSRASSPTRRPAARPGSSATSTRRARLAAVEADSPARRRA
ncbi:MAG: metal ABC transporter ATP-binding protein [Planctomycetes bacterium]|nr:metal ABC transporter ATP-binding protein [Planctomycetota bacterium]